MIEPKTQREKDSYLKGYKEAEAAYGGCHFCYGRGYVIIGKGKVGSCTCERGTELKKNLKVL